MSVTRITCVLSLFKDLVHLVCLCDVFYKAPFTCCDDLCGLTCLCQSIDMTAAITPLALNRHSSCFWLTDFVYKTLRNFRLLSRCPTRRGCRGYRTRRRWGNSLYSNLALINARSINSKSELINDFISSSSIDVLAVTESWLSGDDGDDDLRAICPAGYSFVHHFRGSRGGGIDLIFNSMMTAQRLPSPALHSTFESLDISEIPAPFCSGL